MRILNSNFVRQVIRGAIFAGCFSMLIGCSEGILRKSEVRDIQGKTEEKLSIGDSREKVRSLLGEPVFDGNSHGVEVYRKAGMDIDYFAPLLVIPVPFPGEQVIGYVLITYDEDNLITGLAADYWINLDPGQHGNFWITADGYHFLNVWGEEPMTLLGSAIPWNKLAEQTAPIGTCTLILVMGECVMEKVAVDGQQIADLAPAGRFCSHYANNNLYGTFLRTYMASGSHSLNINQVEKHSKFETGFVCESGDVIYAELENIDAYDDHPVSISISNRPTKNIMKMGQLSPILWHRGVWYVNTDTTP